MPIVRVIKAHEGETIEIQWISDDNSVYITRHTIPPKSTREYKEESDASS